jgi:hypothetical protein
MSIEYPELKRCLECGFVEWHAWWFMTQIGDWWYSLHGDPLGAFHSTASHTCTPHASQKWRGQQPQVRHILTSHNRYGFWSVRVPVSTTQTPNAIYVVLFEVHSIVNHGSSENRQYIYIYIYIYTQTHTQNGRKKHTTA